MNRTEELLKAAIESFEADPPSSPFQKGYYAALLWLLKEAGLDKKVPEKPN